MKNDIEELDPVTEAKHPAGGGFGAPLGSASRFTWMSDDGEMPVSSNGKVQWASNREEVIRRAKNLGMSILIEMDDAGRQIAMVNLNSLDAPTKAAPTVLDMCCGPRMMWFDKGDPRAVFLDKRRERHAMNRPKRGTVEWTETNPDILADFTDMPFADETFEMVVFDPPHFERSGKIGYLAMKYGWLDGDWREMLRKGFVEGFRVLKPGGTLIFKWTATENPVSEILKLTPMVPLFGHKSGKQAQTHWVAFLKPNDKVTNKGSENEH